jgi:protein subunit release factor B
MTKEKEVLFTVTADDCDWNYIRGSGPGGQARNRTASKVRCVHRASGAVGISDETRSQHDNKRSAFRKMAETREFKAWHKLETARKMGTLIDINEQVDKQMRDVNLRVEGRVDGKWVPIEDAPFEEDE